MTDVRNAGLIAKVKRRGGRGDRSALGTWFWDIDRMLLLLTLFLIAIGLIAVAAASPASAVRYSGEHHKIAPLYYFWRQLAWIGIGLPVMVGISMMSRERARRLSLVGAAFFHFPDFFPNGDHGFAEAVQFLLRLAFGGLHH